MSRVGLGNFAPPLHIGHFNQAKNNQEKAQELQDGSRSKSWGDVSSSLDVETILKNSGKIRDLQSKLDVLERIGGRFITASNALEKLEELTNEAQQMMIVAQDDEPNRNQMLKSMATRALKNLQVILNSADSYGNYVFSGSSNVPPVLEIIDRVPNFSVVHGEEKTNANYYQGNDDLFRVNLADIGEIRFPFTAADPSIQKLVMALHKLQQGIKEQSIETLFLEVSSDLVGAKFEIDSTIKNMRQVAEGYKGELDMYGKQLEELQKYPQHEAIIMLTEANNAMEAALRVSAMFLKQPGLKDYV